MAWPPSGSARRSFSVILASVARPSLSSDSSSAKRFCTTRHALSARSVLVRCSRPPSSYSRRRSRIAPRISVTSTSVRNSCSTRAASEKQLSERTAQPSSRNVRRLCETDEAPWFCYALGVLLVISKQNSKKNSLTAGRRSSRRGRVRSAHGGQNFLGLLRAREAYRTATHDCPWRVGLAGIESARARPIARIDRVEAQRRRCDGEQAVPQRVHRGGAVLAHQLDVERRL